jgi:hypothetical protein
MEIKIFEYGVEGGGADVYLLPDNSVVERGNGGGIFDDDPIMNWENKYESWEAWWKKFTSRENWIWLFPVFIHESIHDSILRDVNNYHVTDPHDQNRIDAWRWQLEKAPNERNKMK